MIDAVRLRIVLVALAGWVNRHQLEVIEYLRDENRVLKEHLNGRRLRLTDAQRLSPRRAWPSPRTNRVA